MTSEFDATLTALRELKDGWAGECSEAPSHANIELLRAILIEIPPEFPLPTVRATSNGDLECSWIDYGVYACLTLDNELEITYTKTWHMYERTFVLSDVETMRQLVLYRLRKSTKT